MTLRRQLTKIDGKIVTQRLLRKNELYLTPGTKKNYYVKVKKIDGKIVTQRLLRKNDLYLTSGTKKILF